MKRKITEMLVAWKNSKERKPLIVSGARQVGKTYILKKFGEMNFEQVVYLNLEIEGAISNYIDQELSPQKIIRFIESTKRVEIVPASTLIFVDEIQANERSLTALKYFCEQTPEYFIFFFFFFFLCLR